MQNKSERLQQEYQLRFSNKDEYRNNVWRILCAEYFQKLMPNDSTVLDLGAGWGHFINNIGANEKIAMDLNPDTASRLKENIKIIQQDCSEHWAVDDNYLDVIFSSNFIEHLPDKMSVERTMAEALRCLKPGGKAIFFGPNIKYTKGMYWDFWDHNIPFTDLSLCELLELSGFSITKSIDRFLPYSVATGYNPPLFTVKLYLKLPFLWKIFGKHFLVIAQKPNA